MKITFEVESVESMKETLEWASGACRSWGYSSRHDPLCNDPDKAYAGFIKAAAQLALIKSQLETMEHAK